MMERLLEKCLSCIRCIACETSLSSPISNVYSLNSNPKDMLKGFFHALKALELENKLLLQDLYKSNKLINDLLIKKDILCEKVKALKKCIPCKDIISHCSNDIDH